MIQFNEADNRQLTNLEKLESYIYNFKYKFDFSSKKLIQNSKDEVYLLGTKYQSITNSNQHIELENEKYIKHFQIIIWITYRYKFEPILQEIFNQQYILDTGWGCMVRSGQMMFAEVIKRHIYFKDYQQSNIKQQHLLKIIEYFRDQQDYDFSIQNISRIAYHDINLLPGHWYNSSDICFCLQQITNQLKSIKNHKLQNLNILLLQENLISLDQIYQQFQVKTCECNIIQQKQRSVLIQKKNEILMMEQEKFTTNYQECKHCNSTNLSVQIFLITKLGLSKINPIYFETLKMLIKLEYFTGMLGGQKSQAYYFVGIKEDQLIYLNPHFPQQFKDKVELHSYQEKEIRMLDISSISTSLALTFYLRKPKDAKIFYNQLIEMQKLKQNNFFLSLSQQQNQTNLDDESFLVVQEQQQELKDEDWNIIM